MPSAVRTYTVTRSEDRADKTTLSPSEAQRSAKARPMPDEAPVMTAHGP
jgi:hypothetical protein